MKKLLARLQADYPTLEFVESEVASWSAANKQVRYSLADVKTAEWTLLHELGHALCDHQRYATDVNLVRKEAEAWSKALDIADKYQVSIDKRYIEECMDTYRDWLHKRSTCPECHTHGLQQNKTLYHCPNCQTQWMVSSARFCRPYRLKMAQNT